MKTVVVLTPGLEAQLLSLTQRERPEDIEQKRLVTYYVCPLCGYAAWRMSSASPDGFKVAIEQRNQYVDECAGCMVVQRRAPEIFRWVVGVVLHQQDQRFPLKWDGGDR